MSLDLQHLDTVTFSYKLSSNFSCNQSEDGRISLITDNGILVYTLTNYMNNIFSDIAFRKTCVPVPDLSLGPELGINIEDLHHRLSRNYLFEKILRLDSTSRLARSTPVDLKPIAAEWSPKGLLGKSHSVLSVLSNCYGLSIYATCLDDAGVEEYRSITNVTSLIIQYFSNKWIDISTLSLEAQTDEWCDRIRSTCMTAFTWSSLVENSESIHAVLFVAHLNGSITCWKFFRRNECDESGSDIIYVGEYHTLCENISTLHWRQTRENGGALTYGTYDGKLATINVPDLRQDCLEFHEQTTLLNGKDNRNVDHITSIKHNGYVYLISVQGKDLKVWAISSAGAVLDNGFLDKDDLQITGITHYKENVLLVLTYAKLIKLTLNVVDSRIEMDEENVPLKFDCSMFRTHGLVLSRNRIFLGILAYPCRIKNITRDHTPANFIVYHDSSVSPFQSILRNTSESLEGYWDLFEVLRLLSFREKKFPWCGIGERLDYDNLTSVQLKSLRWVAKLSENVYHVVPFITEYNIKPYILLHYLVMIRHVIDRIRKLFDMKARGEELSIFQMRSIDIQSTFLKEMVLMKVLEKAKVGEKFIDDIIDILERTNELQYPDMPLCFWCHEKIIGPTCIPPHTDSRCSISMMQIPLLPEFKCPFCKCVAHSDVAFEVDVVTCPYCDVPMVQHHPSDEIKRIHQELTVTSDSVDDVDIEAPPLNDEENYVTVSESEDEDFIDERENFLREKFFEMMKSDSLPVASQDYLIDTIAENIAASKDFERNNENSDYSFDDNSDVDEVSSRK